MFSGVMNRASQSGKWFLSVFIVPCVKFGGKENYGVLVYVCGGLESY